MMSDLDILQYIQTIQIEQRIQLPKILALMQDLSVPGSLPGCVLNFPVQKQNSLEKFYLPVYEKNHNLARF